jgi:flavodoxin
MHIFERGLDMDTAVIFYSATGSCALAAKALAEKLGAKLIELKEKKPRDLSKVNAAFMKAGMQAVFKFRSKLLGEPWKDAAGCADVRIVTPIWASRQAPAVNTFLTKYDFKGKTVFLYTVQADAKDSASRARDGMAATVSRKGGNVAGSYGLTASAGPGEKPKQEIAQQICGL